MNNVYVILIAELQLLIDVSEIHSDAVLNLKYKQRAKERAPFAERIHAVQVKNTV